MLVDINVALTALIIRATYLVVLLALGKGHRERMSAYDFVFFAVSGNIAANCIGTSWDVFGQNYLAFGFMSLCLLLIDGIRRTRK